MTRKPMSNEMRASVVAARFAQDIGLAPGNMWEPAIARNLLKAFREVGDWPAVEMEWAFKLGLQREAGAR